MLTQDDLLLSVVMATGSW